MLELDLFSTNFEIGPINKTVQDVVSILKH